MKRLFVFCGLLFVAGCEKKGGSSAPAPGARAGAAVSSDPAEADRAATLARLTQALRKYSAEKQRVPASLDELVAAGYLSELPVAPVGKKYSFDQKLQVQIIDGK